MTNLYIQSEGLVIGLEIIMFSQARLTLTAWYLLIIMCISIIFSAVIFRVLSSEVLRFERSQRSRIENRLGVAPLPPNIELIEDVTNRILFRLTIINIGILVISAVSGYMLAGRTLKPIADMVSNQDRFITDASHELKTPLTSLKSAFEVYLRAQKKTLAESKQLVSESLIEVNKLQQLSESLLTLSQYQKPNGYLLFEKVNIQQLIGEAVHKMLPVAKNKKIGIQTKVNSYRLNVNKDSFVNLMVILIDNAIKYSSPKSNVNITGKKVNNKYQIEVIDTGIGITHADLGHIFDRFYRAKNAHIQRKSNGFGLGLSIAKKIVSTHKGTITVESKPNKGSVFKVTLPFSLS